jgi:hypothetical protein
VVPRTNVFAYLIETKAVIDLLREKVPAVIRFLLPFFYEFRGGIAYYDFFLFFVFPAIKLINIFLGPNIRIFSTGLSTDLFKITNFFNGDRCCPTPFFADAFSTIKV